MEVLIPRIKYLACFRGRSAVLSHDHMHTVEVTSLFILCRQMGGGRVGRLIDNLGTELQVSVHTEVNQFVLLS
jgi:hypothetical protein